MTSQFYESIKEKYNQARKEQERRRLEYLCSPEYLAILDKEKKDKESAAKDFENLVAKKVEEVKKMIMGRADDTMARVFFYFDKDIDVYQKVAIELCEEGFFARCHKNKKRYSPEADEGDYYFVVRWDWDRNN